MHNFDGPSPDDFENDPELRAILDDIEDEIFLIREEELEDSDDDELDDDNDDEDVVSRLSHTRSGAWDDEDYN